MDHQPTDDRDPKPQPGQPAPTQWERRPSGGIKETLESGEQLYTGVEGEAGYLADDQASLQSKLRGGGRDRGEVAEAEYTKLCPACHTVTSFVQGVCSSCAYRDGDPLPDLPASFEPSGVNPSLVGGLIAAIVIVVLVVLGFIYGPKLLASRRTADQTTTAPPAAVPVQPTASGQSSNHASGLDPVKLDDAFYKKLSSTLEQGNAAWAAAGKDCYAYRFNVFDATVPATRQDVTITAYLGGQDAQTCSVEPGLQPFHQATSAWLETLNGQLGVNAIIRLTYNVDGTFPSDEDHYLRYGYWYGRDHWSLLKPVVDNLESQKQSQGQYPDMLAERLLGGKLQTRGGMFFVASGVGYLPVFKTDSGGKIIMGQGAGIASFKPEECIGYYLFVYLDSENQGLDLYSQADLKYYREKIQPFPYQPETPIANATLNPDGEPDGIACVIHNGKLTD